MPIRFYTPSGKSAGGVELAADYAAAEKAGAGKSRPRSLTPDRR